MQVHESEEDQAISLSKESKIVLSLIHNIDTKNKNDKKPKISNRCCVMVNIKYVQH